MSTAESEPIEALEGFTIGDSGDALILDREPFHSKQLLVDNMAAASLIHEGPTSSRARHLKIRSQNWRWRISNVDWKVSLVHGRYQRADHGGKGLAAPRLDELKAPMPMGGVTDSVDEKAEIPEP